MSLSSSSFNLFNTRLQSSALDSVRKAIALPNDIAFHRSVDSELATQMEALSARVLNITNRILGFSQISSTSLASKTGDDIGGKWEKAEGRLRSQDEVIDSFQAVVVDVVDQLFERTDTCLDGYLGRTKPPAIAISPSLTTPRKATHITRSQHGSTVIQHVVHLPKPQLSFKIRPDNLVETPWYPSLSHKFNAKVPLGFLCEDEPEDPWKRHPYHYEITHLDYPPSMFLATPPIVPPPLLAASALTYVDTLSELHTMLEYLRTADVIAVDLEHHSHRSYRGFVCLMQISTRERDWVVDTLVAEVREELGILNEVFTNPKIVKVFHGAESDIVWLQRDFSLFVVNLFDTFHASKILNFPRHGLANLLEMYCDFTPDKQYQLADWRIRPLPEAMLNYARSDTHFLLFIYDNLRNALLDRGLSQSRSQSQTNSRSSSPPTKKSSKSPSPRTTPAVEDNNAYLPHALMNEVLARSAATALRVYEREMYDAENGGGVGGWEGLARKWNKGGVLTGDHEQGRVYRAVHAWRDKVAREEDESTRYVLPNHHIFQFAERPPKDMAGLLGMFPASRVPMIVRKRAKELLDVVLSAARGGALETTDNMAVDSTEVPAAPAPVEEGGEEASPVDTSHQPAKPGPSELDLPNRIWSTEKASSATLTKSVSTLLGPLKPPKQDQSTSTYVAIRSSLLGNWKGDSNLLGGSRALRFTEVLGRIHSSLTVMPTVPQAASTTMIKDSTSIQAVTEQGPMTVDSANPTTTLKMEAEIPFVPLSERKTRVVAETEEDAIIVVGQRSGKRKRVKSNNEAAESSTLPITTAKKPKKAKGGEVEKDAEKPFDYSTVPNILDNVPVQEAANVKPKKKKKEAKGGVFEYGDFPRPPKAHSELRSGNQSYTFRQ